MPVYTQAELLSQLSKLYRGKHTPPTQLLANIIDSLFAPVPASILSGFMADWPMPTAPTGWLLRDGTVYNIATYPALGALLGSLYGGDGITTFAVPDHRQKYSAGAAPGVPGKESGNLAGLDTVEAHQHEAGSLQVVVGGETVTAPVVLNRTVGADGTYNVIGQTEMGGGHDNRPQTIYVTKIIKT